MSAKQHRFHNMPDKRRLVTTKVCFGSEKAGLLENSYNKCALVIYKFKSCSFEYKKMEKKLCAFQWFKKIYMVIGVLKLMFDDIFCSIFLWSIMFSMLFRQRLLCEIGPKIWFHVVYSLIWTFLLSLFIRKREAAKSRFSKPLPRWR